MLNKYPDIEVKSQAFNIFSVSNSIVLTVVCIIYKRIMVGWKALAVTEVEISFVY